MLENIQCLVRAEKCCYSLNFFQMLQTQKQVIFKDSLLIQILGENGEFLKISVTRANI